MAFSVAIMLISCHQGKDGTEDQLAQTADSFAVHYFNYQFKQALPFCTEDSEKWLRFAASNTLDDDVELLCGMEEPATMKIDRIMYANDSTAMVTFQVENCLYRDTIGKAGRILRHGIFSLDAIKENGIWRIRMAGLPRNERRNRD